MTYSSRDIGNAMRYCNTIW